jgi:hypothetical protein
VVRVRVEATQEEIALITQAARKLASLRPNSLHAQLRASAVSGSCKRARVAAHHLLETRTATSETEVLIDIGLSHRLQSNVVILGMHSQLICHRANRSIIHATTQRRRGK